MQYHSKGGKKKGNWEGGLVAKRTVKNNASNRDALPIILGGAGRGGGAMPNQLKGHGKNNIRREKRGGKRSNEVRKK